METLGTLEDLVKMFLSFIYLPYLALFMVLAYMVKNQVKTLIQGIRNYSAKRLFGKVLTGEVSMAWVVALIGALVAIPFIYVNDWRPDLNLKVPDDGQIKTLNAYSMRLFFSYCIGTSFHDLIIYQFLKLIGREK